jgi:RNA polymerase sigma-70 factor, ECF subfamily
MTRSERTLWRRWVERRDGDAFAALVRRHARFVYDFARRVAGNAADAEDLTQEAYLKLAEAKPEEPDAVGLRAFLGRRVVLGARMLKRAALARRRHEGRAAIQGGAGGPEQIERREQAQKALDLLPAGERRAVELRFLHDLSYAEIAGVLGTTEEAARMRVHRGLERMKSRLGRDASACFAAFALFEPPARMLASTAKTALLIGGVVVGKKASILVGLALLLGLLGTVGVHWATRERGDHAERATVAVKPESAVADEPNAAGQPALPPAPPSFHGEVVDAAGKPVSHATVRVMHFAGRWQWLETSTGEDGAFAIDVAKERCAVEARHPSYATTVVDSAETGVRLVLEPGVPVRVEVRGGGAPIHGARVAATNGGAMLLCDPSYVAIGEGVTDETGVAEFHVPPGRWEFWASAPGWAPTLAPPIVCALGHPQEACIGLEPGGFVEGTVRDGGSAGVAGVRVVVQAHPGFRGTTMTGADGSYVLEHVPLISGPALLVAADHPDHAAASEWRMWNASDGERMRFDLVFRGTSGLCGIVLDAPGQPQPDRRMVVEYAGAGFHILYGYAWMSDRYPFAGTTDGHGRFELKGLPPGKATIYLFPEMERFPVELLPRQTTGPVELRLAAIALRGRVLDADGNPVEEALVGEAKTDAMGRFASKQRPKEIVVQAPGHVASAHAVDGDFVEIRLSALAVAGTVVDPDGHGVPDVTVTLYNCQTQSGYAETRTDQGGGFRFRGASKANLYQLGVRVQPGRDLVGGTRLVRGPQEGLVLVLASTGQAERRLVRGTAVDEAGRPIEGPIECRPVGIATVFQIWTSQRAGWPGGFVCEHLEPLGRMSLVFHAAGFLPSDPVEVHYDGRTPLGPLTVRFKRGAEVEVSVVDGQGTPFKGAHVFGYASGGINGRTDAEGRCVLAGLPPGRNRITVSHPHLADANEAYVEATAGTRQRVEFRGRACGKIVASLPADAKAKTSLVFRLLDAAGRPIRDDRIEKSRLALMEQQGLREHDFAVTGPGTYRIRCEIDGIALPEAEVEVRLRETVEVELKR